ncbi:hypothetical protein [Streptomyces wuyuanensis]|uniref:Uncharacterized protein n=1 Tax=Streptomyces wuyuanensis TaxID=1196353 RepID=A0A1H0AGN1_9ACTN|nr:hypothetical protein [Streptomyces wuyuanensis]SDN32471.1 hypothetical protein SAMN05444921_12448 [Streptomyces wuyuanensis]
MGIAVTVSVIIAMIVIGVLLIRLLNGQHDERIAAFHYSDTLPGFGRRSRKGRRPQSMPGGNHGNTPRAEEPPRSDHEDPV